MPGKEHQLRLESITIENFKSIRRASFSFSDFTCLIGPNNSGKSNALDALLFLRALAERPVPETVRANGGAGFFHYGAKQGDSASFRLLLSETKNRAVQLEYLLVIGRDSTVVEEKLTRLHKKTHANLAENEPSILAHLRRGDDGVAEIDVAGAHGRIAPPTESMMLRWRDAPQLEPFQRFARGIRGYKFSPDRLKAMGPATETPELARDGANLASHLHWIQSRHRKHFHRIEEQLKNSFPEIEELTSPLVGNQTVVGIKEQWFDQQAEGAQLSEGLLGFLAHLVVFYGPTEPSLLIFEEPENYVHSRLLERLAHMMQEASRETQSIITTHSVTLLNQLDLNEIRLVERQDGGTSVRPVQENAHLRESLKEWGLGDAYFSGALGGATN